MKDIIRIGTRDSELAIWQATEVKKLLDSLGHESSLVFIKSEGDIDLQTPLYEMGVQGIFTKSLDIALLNNSIDIAVHSMKDVPTQLPQGIIQAAVLKRGNYKDLFVFNEVHQVDKQLANDLKALNKNNPDLNSTLLDEIGERPLTIATSSIRRKAQWLSRYPKHNIENLRGNINSRLLKVNDNKWAGAIFAAAGLERINLMPKNAMELNWMLPAPAQGAIMIVCRQEDEISLEACAKFNNIEAEICTKIERDFLRGLLGGCSTPIGALAQFDKNDIYFKGNILSTDGKQKIEIEKYISKDKTENAGTNLAEEILKNGAKEIVKSFTQRR